LNQLRAWKHLLTWQVAMHESPTGVQLSPNAGCSGGYFGIESLVGSIETSVTIDCT
jgi:hypothetical protein